MGRQSSPTYPTWIPYSPLSQPRAPQPRSCVYLYHKGWVQLLILWNSFLAFPGCDWGIKTKEEAPQKAEVSHLDLKKNTHPTKQVLHKLLQHLVLCLARSKDSFNIEWINEWMNLCISCVSDFSKCHHEFWSFSMLYFYICTSTSKNLKAKEIIVLKCHVYCSNNKVRHWSFLLLTLY